MNADATKGIQGESQESGDTVGKASRSRWSAIATGAGWLAGFSFALLVILMLSTPSWRYGPFTWLPLFRVSYIAGAPMEVGGPNLLPFLLLAGWLVRRFASWRARRPLVWTFGRPGVTVPLLLLTLLGLVTLDPGFPRTIFIQVGALAIFWLLYLFLLNERPNVIIPLSIVVLIQGSVALGQFLRQGDLGLVDLGELPLNPIHSGISVLFVEGQRWLRGYGLTAHPNLLAAMLTAILLLLLPAFKRSQGIGRALLAMVYAVGVVGLFTSFSRASTLAFVVGLVVWWVFVRERPLRSWSRPSLKELLRSPFVLLGLGLFIIFVLLFGNLALSRVVTLNSTVEAISINQRLADARRALIIIGQHPFFGVGLGQYIEAARKINPVAVVVHNVPLLVTAELGLIGLLLLLWLTLSGLRSRPSALAPWLAVLIIGFFDITLWLTSSWQTAVLFAFITANLSQDITARSRDGVG